MQNIPKWAMLLLMASLLVSLTACSSSAAPPGEAGQPAFDIPAQYRDLVNPLQANQDRIAAGERTYQKVCASCHGQSGAGDGPAAAIEPEPPDFTDRDRMSGLSDGYLYWRIAEGGSADPFNSSMPAWGAVFEEEQIWELVAYLRTFAD